MSLCDGGKGILALEVCFLPLLISHSWLSRSDSCNTTNRAVSHLQNEEAGTQPLHTISFTIAVGLGVMISDPITAVGWPISNTLLDSYVLSSYHQ